MTQKVKVRRSESSVVASKLQSFVLPYVPHLTRSKADQSKKLNWILPVAWLLLVSSAVGLGSDPKRTPVLVQLKSNCDSLLAQSHQHYPMHIEPQGHKRYFGLLAQRYGTRGTENQFLALIPYFSAFGHQTLYRTSRKRGAIETLWMGKLDLGNMAHSGETPPRIRLVEANETSGQWARWLALKAGHPFSSVDEALAIEQTVDIKGIRHKLNHQNSVDHLNSYFLAQHPLGLAPTPKLRRWDPNDHEIHLDSDLNALVSLVREILFKDRKDALININHDVRSPMSVVTSALEIIRISEASGTLDESTVKVIFGLMYEARKILGAYLKVLQNEYPDDSLLADARATLATLENLEVALQTRSLTIDEQNELLHLKEVLEFVINTPDVNAVHFMDPAF